jgi:hypothetical protein
LAIIYPEFAFIPFYTGERDMNFPQDAHVMYVVFQLMERGLSADTIDRAMKKMVGTDWAEVHVSTWHERLQADGSFIEDNADVFVDDLAALIYGRTKLEDICYLDYLS